MEKNHPVGDGFKFIGMEILVFIKSVGTHPGFVFF